jgi:hypothetical protein
MAQKSSFYADQKPLLLQAFVGSIKDVQLRKLAFDVGITGIVQSVIANGSEYKQIINSCEGLNAEFYTLCVKGIVGGLYEHGEPQQEYKKALIFCAEPSIAAHNNSNTCYLETALRLRRFYSPAQVQKICTEFPKEYQLVCTTATQVSATSL